MKIKSGFVVRPVAGQHMVVALGEASKSFNGIIKLNESARIIWDMLVEGAEREAVIARLLEEYDVDRDILQADCDKFIQSLQENNILE